MSNYDVVEDDTLTLIDDIISEKFSILNGCLIQPILYTKKKKTKGKYEITKLSKPNALIKHIYSIANNGNDMDYILIIYSEVFYALDDKDKMLSIIHALEYADVDTDNDDPYKLRGAEVETFYDELDLTKEDPLWQQRIQTIAESVYAKEKDN